MGYDIHITRATSWADSLRKPITIDEWLRVARYDTALRRESDADEAFFEFASGDSWFDYSEGCVFTKNPNAVTLAKAHELAVKLRAKVQGDDGEIYLPNGEQISSDVQVAVRYPLWLLLLCLFSIGCFVALLVHLLA